MNKIFLKFYNNIAIASVIAIFFVIDRVLKNIAFKMADFPAKNLLGDFFSFEFTKNYFISFSLPLSGWFLNIIIIIIIFALSFYINYLLRQKGNRRLEITCLSFVLLGALSNFIDRLAFGYVVDYLALRYFTVFNLADVMISIPALILIFVNFRSSRLEARKK